MSILDVICDNANQDLDKLPPITMQMSNLKMLYLENNRLTSLPEDFFYKLPLLNWLDLRSNQLTAIPVSIEFHSFLGTMLLQNNKIKRLPNQLGVVPNLKVLQLNGNPLQYPGPETVQGGIEDICAFLKIKYDKQHIGQNQNIYLKEPVTNAVTLNPRISYTTSSTSTKSTQNKQSNEEIRRTVCNRFDKPRTPNQPVLTVKSLSKLHKDQLEKQEDSLEQNEEIKRDKPSLESSTESETLIQECLLNEPTFKSSKLKTSNTDNLAPQLKLHKILSERSKLSVRSHCSNSQSKYVNSSKKNIWKDTININDGPFDFGEDRFYEKRVQGQELKDLWLGKLKDLLQDQEKIIQQERNLNVLNDWRQEKKKKPIRPYDPDKLIEDTLPPYDIDPEYSRIPSRSDLTKQLDKLVRRDRKKHPRNVDMQRLINNLIKQLQEIEATTQETYNTGVSPQKKFESTEKEIKMIMDLHKKISALQSQNTEFVYPEELSCRVCNYPMVSLNKEYLRGNYLDEP